MVEKTLNTLTQQKPSFILDYRLIADDRKIKWVHDQGRGIFNKSGDLLYIDGSILEITDRKKYEKTL